MTVRRTEKAALVVLVAVFLAGGLVFESHRQITELAAEGTHSISARQLYISGLFIATLASLSLAFLVMLFAVLPLVRAQSREQGKLHTLTAVLRRRSKEMEQAAFTDVLTGLHNRRYFDEVLGQFMEAFGRIGRPLGLMVVDLDHFKAINDTYGHDVGDEVLRAVSRCLSDHSRYHDVVARLGGEEFAIIVPNMNLSDLSTFANRIRVAVERLSMDVGNVRLRITMSIGIVVAQPGEDTQAFYKRADVNLYAAKEAGRNRICA